MSDLPDPEKMTPRQRERRRRIIDAAIDLVLKASENVEIRDIVDAADVSLATLYRYFGSKEVLFAEVYVHWRQATHAKVAAAIASGSTDSERLRMGTRSFIEAYRPAPRMWDLSTQTRLSHDPEITKLRKGNEGGTFALFRDAMHQTPEEDAAGIVVVLMAVAASHMDQWRGGDLTLDEVHEAMDRAIWLTVGIREAHRDTLRHALPSG
ncbi:TetR/AcrR family transcriptional regulator [Amaricoccus sp. W119]|uniref:TetR/AcrR family transcriptional regulator n=1 Tax=Amaricoccus sp. W119 TaxID=3391833 RepID=UPI0039A5B2D2